MNNEPKTYLIAYKNGKTQTVTGRIFLFSSGPSIEVPRINNVIFLNANEVLSVIEQTEKEVN